MKVPVTKIRLGAAERVPSSGARFSRRLRTGSRIVEAEKVRPTERQFWPRLAGATGTLWMKPAMLLFALRHASRRTLKRHASCKRTIPLPPHLSRVAQHQSKQSI